MPRALIADPSPAVFGAFRQTLEAIGFEVRGVRTVDEAVAEVHRAEPDLLVAAVAPGTFDGEGLCQRVKKSAPGCAVVLTYPPDAGDPDAAAVRAMSDAYLVAPIKRGNVVSCVRTLMKVRSLQDQVARLEGELQRHASEAALPELGRGAGGQAEPQDFEFFKKFLLLEVKRSRRYRYPVSFLLFGIDPGSEGAAAAADDLTAVLAEALQLITRGVRDIDLAVPFTEARCLLFLPHTPRAGAEVVASRARDRLQAMKETRQVSFSVGMASFEPGPNAPHTSFGGLMKDAADALRRAQAAGGDRVEGAATTTKKRDRISLG